jgi:hypothetical protein
VLDARIRPIKCPRLLSQLERCLKLLVARLMRPFASEQIKLLFQGTKVLIESRLLVHVYLLLSADEQVYVFQELDELFFLVKLLN